MQKNMVSEVLFAICTTNYFPSIKITGHLTALPLAIIWSVSTLGMSSYLFLYWTLLVGWELPIWLHCSECLLLASDLLVVWINDIQLTYNCPLIHFLIPFKRNWRSNGNNIESLHTSVSEITVHVLNFNKFIYLHHFWTMN